MTKLDVIRLSQDLIRIPSYSGVNREIISFLSGILQNLGFACDMLEFDGDDSYPVNNLHAVFNPKNSNRILYFAGHTDVVKEGDLALWKYDPFSATISDGKIFGRGAADMKCAIAAFVSAVFEFLAQNKNPDFGIGFLITNDEENDSINGTRKILEWMEKQDKKISHCLVGEPTNPQKFGEMIKVGRRGSISFKVKIIGKQGHVAYPENALNPITILINLLKILKDHKFDEGTKFFDPGNLEITAISSQNLGGNVTPNEAWAEFNVRFNDAHTSQSIIDLVDYACKKTVGLGAKYELSNRASGDAFLSEPKFLAPIVVNAVEKICGIKPALSTSGGTSDARFIKDYAEVVEIGMINKTAHKIDEFSEVNEVKQLQQTYLEILKIF
ncbi:MAG: succinyl-diaminopimelate desuccinylase [Alphaproteobacteria bacterium RIFCSPLOWO2_01_FULL_40_26]|nr:MAG: succinyl-diaminopimelate desuccinylase [Alphaproteobacteria bacterium RIFCSPHIGHO2_02_FULL_40_34]OFW89041.1 MAG: succinyl-diaminopimelate desuccinylase [Alphaproteobacteria bacterium RIFCSPHIGHO2_01_FULL_40_8]OFW94617.1 MAG: succinyl-diaminopimelate desuccinylase [Alphaproteobacteria bacterium RIFCSPLOWO2_01_FULL_40_26]OFX10085.1 MAG: succinyl-diaminopimelate desuccinylase [Alphaproteobacteria bacterium RIFCSPLOWO2_02_FULL_40_19]OFX11716.1 MAG: succinyl-diaminopimelate desuccinylase [Al